MKPHELKPPEGSHQTSKRKGRGDGSGKGKTAGRGTKGTRARGEVHVFFEGGQMPLARRVPKLKGFTPPNRTIYEGVNVKDLSLIETASIGPEEMRKVGLINRRVGLVKILGTGELDRALTVRAHAFSATAKTKIEDAGGTVEVIKMKPKPPVNGKKGAKK